MTLTTPWQLAEAATLRPEAFGGIAFHRRRGVTIEVDAAAYGFLCSCQEPRPLPSPGDPAARLVPQLVRLGFLEPAGAVRPAATFTTAPWPGDGYTLSAPETVHLALTARCNRSCPGCYVSPTTGPELTPAEWCELIVQWSRLGVFQLAIGGGEPLLYPGLYEVLECVRQQGLVAGLTTNGALLNAETIHRLEQAGLARINVSWNGPDENQGHDAAERALGRLVVSSLQVGVNLLATPAVLSDLPHTLAHLRQLGVRRVTVLRPKPPAAGNTAGASWYAVNRLGRTDLARLRKILAAWRTRLELEIDSALVGLLAEAPAARLRWRGIHGCAAGRRICTVWSDGRVIPCSFLPDLVAGNVRATPFAELWPRGAGWESLRDPGTHLQGGCRECAVAALCGGARCISRHEQGELLAGDIECPSAAYF